MLIGPRRFTARVSSVQPAADPTTQRYTVVLEMEDPPDNLMTGMTGEMNIITGTHENALLVPTRALLVDQALVVKRGIVHSRTVGVGFRTLDFTEVTSGLTEGSHVIVSDQDKFRPGRSSTATNGQFTAAAKGTMTPPLYIALRFLTHRKRALLLSLSGVVFGVAIFICTQAQTQGFARYFIDSTIGSNGALVIRSRFRPRYEPLMVSAKGSKGTMVNVVSILKASLTPMKSCG